MRRLARTIALVALVVGSGGTGAVYAQQDRPLPTRKELLARQQFVQSYAASASCMIHAARVAVMQGAQTRDQALSFIETACLESFRAYFIATGQLTTVEAAKLWVVMSDRAVDEAISGPAAIIIR